MPSNRINGYGITGLFVAINTAIAWFLVHNKGDTCKNLVESNYSHIQLFHVIAFVVGVTLFVLGILNIAGRIGGMAVLIFVAMLGIAAVGGLLVYAAILDFQSPCVLSVDGFFKNIGDRIQGKDHNIFSAKDGHMIAVFVLDILSALMLFSASGSFYRNR